ncbi:MAG: N-acetylmuramic acid 6-phosphate etherase [candidate division Zixibacteria bacterium]|nr:N-acetylmuramic acid 6-phosphate etherase [candidate division Zixibacteria bacterium]
MSPIRKLTEDRIKAVLKEIEGLVTEISDPRFSGIDRSSTEDILHTINREDATVAGAVKREIPYIAKAVDLINENISNGGRIFYFGAGTSGRLGILDAAECPPTFGTDPSLIKGIIAGGEQTVFLSAEGAEDDVSKIPMEFDKYDIKAPDTIVAISASRRTPFATESLTEGKKRGCSTVFITCNPREEVDIEVDAAICVVVGPEVVAGSTRMKAALAQKMILTMLSTTIMVKRGKLYKNLMVDLLDRSEKLSARSIKIVMTVVDCDYEKAVDLLKGAEGKVKHAIIMGKLSVSSTIATKLLKESKGFLYKVLGE